MIGKFIGGPAGPAERMCPRCEITLSTTYPQLVSH